MIDAHAHLDSVSEDYLPILIDNAKKVNMKTIITQSVNLSSMKKSLEIKNKYPEIVKLAAGLYPEDTLKVEDFEKLKEFVKENRSSIVALGEIGLDLHQNQDNFEIQKEVFIKELDLAKEENLPVIIHTRKAEEQVLEILKNYSELKIILHCFCGKKRLIKEAISRDYYFSIPTNIVRTQSFQWLAENAPRDKVLTETDTPYLSPFKEKQNEPAFISESIKTISKIWNLSYEETEKQIETNFEKLF